MFCGAAEPGPFAAGLRVVDEALHFYPAAPGGDSTSWTIRELVGPADDVHADLLDLPLASLHDATSDEHARPLIVFDGGLTSTALAYLPHAEHLASHGLHAVTLPSVAPDGDGPLTFDAAGIRRKTANLERTFEQALAWPSVDRARFALAAWSVGGVSTALLAARAPAVRALLSLDGGLGYEYGAPLYRELTDRPVTVSFLHVTGTAANAFPVPKALEFDLVEGDDAFLAELEGINHSQFFFDGSAAAEHVWEPQAALLELMRSFFDHAFGAQNDDFAGAARLFGPSAANRAASRGSGA